MKVRLTIELELFGEDEDGERFDLTPEDLQDVADCAAMALDADDIHEYPEWLAGSNVFAKVTNTRAIDVKPA